MLRKGIFIVTPFAWLARRVTLGPRALILGTTAALIVSIFIVFSGGVVRVTGSGLGCPTWPACEAGSLTTTPALGIHGLIEFANRALTGVLIIAVGWAITAARLQKHRNRMLTRLAWSQFWLVIVNSIAGGISVLTGLNPYVVAMHFVLAIALLTTTTLTWHRARQSVSGAGGALQAPSAAALSVTPQSVTPQLITPQWPTRLSAISRSSTILSSFLVIVTLLLIALGTLVTGSGEHSGDSADVPRMGFVWAQVTVFHGVLGSLVLLLALVLYADLRRRTGTQLARRRVGAFLAVTLAQAALGVVQANIGVPAGLVAIHVLGSALVWVGVLRVFLDVNPRLFRVADIAQPTQAPVAALR